MKKIGFIDYYLDEWHANEYPGMIARLDGDNFTVAYAYGKIDSPLGGLTNAQWAEKHGVTLCDTIEEVVEKSDCLIVLAPDNAEQHVALTECALRSGKPVFIDKTFSANKADAETIFAFAKEGGAPCFSSSALRFSPKLNAVKKEGICHIVGIGCGAPDQYLVHQLEPIATLMGTAFDSVMYLPSTVPSWTLRFADGRTAMFTLSVDAPFDFKVCYADGTADVAVDDNFFDYEIKKILHMFNTGEAAVDAADTIAIMAAREACLKAMDTPLAWVAV